MPNKCKNLLEYYKNNKLLSNNHKKILEEYDQHYVLKGASEVTRVGTSKVLFYLARDIKKPFKDMTKKDIINFFANYTVRRWNGGKGRNNFIDTGQRPSKDTLRTYMAITIYFLKWLGKKDIADYLLSVKPLKNLDGRAKPNDVWLEEEIKKLIECAGTLRNKTALSVLYEMSGRISEAIGLNISDVKFNNDGTTELTIRQSKTQEGRLNTRFLFNSTPLLKEYIETHPLKNDPDAPLFITFHDQTYRGTKPIERLLYGGWITILKYAHNRSGIKKKLYLHLLRVSHTTNSIKAGYSLPVVQKMGAWRNINSMRPYLKLADTDVRDAILEKNGITKEQEKANELFKNKKCLKCGEINNFDRKYCYKCSTPLDINALFEQKKKDDLKDKFIEMLMGNEELKDLALKKSSENIRTIKLLRQYKNRKLK